MEEVGTAERWAPAWWAVFLIGLVMWAAAFAVARVTRNVILLPTIVLLGSFLVPVTGVIWYLDHDPSPALSPRRILVAFIIAGTFGVLGASLLEYWLVSAGLFVVQGGQLYLSLNSVVVTELIRGVLSPFGHGMWSAILGGAIFAAAARHGRLRLSATVLVAYLAVSVLHGAFDSINGIEGYVVVSLIGLVPLVWLWRRGGGGGVLPRHRPAPSSISVAR